MSIKSKIFNKRMGIIALIFLFVGCFASYSSQNSNFSNSENLSFSPSESSNANSSSSVSIAESPTESSQEEKQPERYEVVSVVDGDTIKVNYQGQTTSVRLIGVNTPETVDPRKDVECYGREASDYLKNLLTGKTVTLEADSSQTDRDKYNRLLRYVYLDGQDVNYQIIASGYGYEYTYNVPYQKQSSYKSAQSAAESAGKGLWAAGACQKTTTAPASNSSSSSNTANAANNSSQSASGSQPSNNSSNSTNSSNSASSNAQSAPAKQPASTPAPSTNTTGDCKIKGNISSKGEKIYHVPGGAYYNRTSIDTSKGERWFCSEADARAAGWRPSQR